MDITSLITQLVGGAAGGNAAGPVLKDKNPGGLVNSISGMLGGGILGQVLQHFMGSGGTDLQGILTNVLGGAGGGGILALIVGFLKSRFAPKSK